MEYNFHSTDPDNYAEVRCPVIYTGVSTNVKWYISDITTNHNIVVLSKDDYLTIFDEMEEIKIVLSKNYLEIGTDFPDQLTEMIKAKGFIINVSKNEENCYQFESESYFEITDMSYNLKQVLGFYYLDDVKLKSTQVDDTYIITSKAVGFDSLQPMWYLISNLGQPIQITLNNDCWTPIFPAIVMKIQNSFQAGQPLTYSNSEYMSTCSPAALSNLRVKLVDGNLHSITLKNPLYVSVSVQDIPEEEKQPVEEAMAEQEENKDTKKLMKDTMTKYHERKDTNHQKVETGISDDSQLPDIQLDNHEQTKEEILAQTKQVE